MTSDSCRLEFLRILRTHLLSDREKAACLLDLCIDQLDPRIPEQRLARAVLFCAKEHVRYPLRPAVRMGASSVPVMMFALRHKRST